MQYVTFIIGRTQHGRKKTDKIVKKTTTRKKKKNLDILQNIPVFSPLNAEEVKLKISLTKQSEKETSLNDFQLKQK